MSEATQTAPTYDVGAEYQVKLNKPVRVSGVLFRPMGEHTMTGGFLNRVIEEYGVDVIDSVTVAL